MFRSIATHCLRVFVAKSVVDLAVARHGGEREQKYTRRIGDTACVCDNDRAGTEKRQSQTMDTQQYKRQTCQRCAFNEAGSQFRFCCSPYRVTTTKQKIKQNRHTTIQAVSPTFSECFCILSEHLLARSEQISVARQRLRSQTHLVRVYGVAVRCLRAREPVFPTIVVFIVLTRRNYSVSY